MTPEELVSQLAPVRFPESFARFGTQDALAAVALGILIGLALSALLRLLTRRRVRPVDAARARIAALQGLDDKARLAGLAALLRRFDAEAPQPEAFQRALYDPQAAFDPARLEHAILQAAQRGGRP